MRKPELLPNYFSLAPRLQENERGAVRACTDRSVPGSVRAVNRAPGQNDALDGALVEIHPAERPTDAITLRAGPTGRPVAALGILKYGHWRQRQAGENGCREILPDTQQRLVVDAGRCAWVRNWSGQSHCCREVTSEVWA